MTSHSLAYIVAQMTSAAGEGYCQDDADITALTGLAPDERYFKPLEEQRLLIELCQAGESEAKEVLLTQSLRRIYRFTQDALELSGRTDLDPEDVMQMGALAVLEAAAKVNTENENVNVEIASYIRRSLSQQLVQARVAEVPVGVYPSQLDPHFTAEQQRQPELEEEVFRNIDRQNLRDMLENLSYRERRVLELLYGLDGAQPIGLDEIGKEFSLTRERE